MISVNDLNLCEGIQSGTSNYNIEEILQDVFNLTWCYKVVCPKRSISLKPQKKVMGVPQGSVLRGLLFSMSMSPRNTSQTLP